ncbi:imidazolonepropionase-like amidohydrolase [Tahibacter aquaticus]|uniref:Imidazolonepropionase-like amidohydrolase n=1 Tax=Tahibacter aquaticus TaxID=520092 RepID=A0A4R6Z2P0_9GAMM|nr:amidohydrolase family protein [Tahibacter aquaticus]TDR45875.1 imidazolonepropionase-like amidohydrolase [Tahibacter aquaticus]
MKRLALFCLAAFSTTLQAASPAYVLSGADLHTVSHGTIAGGELLIRDGKIAAIGARVDAPADALRIDLKGKRIYPGLIASDSLLGLTEVDAVRATVDMAESGSVNPNARALVAIDADSELLPVARSNGVLTVHVVPRAGEDGLLTGQSALVKLDGWTWEEMSLVPSVGVHLVWPSSRVPPWLPAKAQEKAAEALRKNLAAIDTAFREARSYQAARKGKLAGAEDLRWEAMLPVLDGQQPLFVHADDAVQIRDSLAFAQRENLRLVLVGGMDAWRFAATLKARDVPVILGSSHNLPLRRWESYDTLYSNAGKLAAAGVRLAIANESGSSNERNLPYQAASYAAFGLDREAALRAITLGPAEILGVADRLGSLDVGKDATLFVADNDALENFTHVERAWIQGREVDMSNRHTRLNDKYRGKYSGKPKD